MPRVNNSAEVKHQRGLLIRAQQRADTAAWKHPEGRGKGVSPQKRRRESSHFLPFFTSIPWHPEGTWPPQACVKGGQTWTRLWFDLKFTGKPQLFWPVRPLPPSVSRPRVFSSCSAVAPPSALKRVVVENWESLLNLDEGTRKTPGGRRGWRETTSFCNANFSSHYHQIMAVSFKTIIEQFLDTGPRN